MTSLQFIRGSGTRRWRSGTRRWIYGCLIFKWISETCARQGWGYQFHWAVVADDMPCHMIRGHYNDVIMSTIASQITSLTIFNSTVYSGADQRKHQSSASLAFVRGIHRGPMNSPHKWPVMRKMFPFNDVIMGSWVSMTVAGVLVASVRKTFHCH